MAELILRKGQQDEKHLELNQDVSIGRSYNDHEDLNTTQLRIADTQMSRRHGRIFLQDSQFFIEDLASTNGTYINQRKIASGKAYPLRHRDSIVMGASQLLFFNPEEVTAKLKPNDGFIERGSEGKPDGLDVRIVSDDATTFNVSKVFDAEQLLESIQQHEKSIEDYQRIINRLQAMTQVSIALGAETNRDKRNQIIVDSLFKIFPSIERVFIGLADTATGELTPVIASSRHKPLPTDEILISRTILREVVDNKKSLLLLDAINDQRYQENLSIVNLSLRSVMCAPLIYKNDVLGIIQVDSHNEPNVFQEDDLQVLTGISAQVAISVKNAQLHENIEQLFEGFVTASVQAIEDRDPITAGHSFRVADYTCQLAEAVDRSTSSVLRQQHFSREQMKEIRYASLLHDFGKVGVKENVLQKAKKLYPAQLQLIKQRFEYAQACLQADFYRKLCEASEEKNMSPGAYLDYKKVLEKELTTERRRLEHFLAQILQHNEPVIGYEEMSDQLKDIHDYEFQNHQLNQQKILTEFEFSALELSHGSLTPEERIDIETHVSHTFTFLNHIPWTDSLANVPDIAHAHHEKLDGTGYPQQLTADQIPIQSQIMAIADIFDALTAVDRPYKRSLQPDQALELMQVEVNLGKLNKTLFDVFIESRSYILTN